MNSTEQNYDHGIRLLIMLRDAALSVLSDRTFEEFRVVGNVVAPKLTHNSLYVVRLEATPIGKAATKLAPAHCS
ncbi:hypothetical protein LMTR13_08345 [Bradyrhizobium icense]|uniref:Uncharacterized protein n=1 Tax=Bradyrhizobium icense TaxID=1274631 RepID=A0A1B1UBN7_9BRAD|nr:hypothetical protein LMTR13_08345 [Bradyrhizobium icense]